MTKRGGRGWAGRRLQLLSAPNRGGERIVQTKHMVINLRTQEIQHIFSGQYPLSSFSLQKSCSDPLETCPGTWATCTHTSRCLEVYGSKRVNVSEIIFVFKLNDLPLLQNLALKPCYNATILYPTQSNLKKKIYLVCAVVYYLHTRNTRLRKQKLLWTFVVNVSGSCEWQRVGERNWRSA